MKVLNCGHVSGSVFSAILDIVVYCWKMRSMQS